MARQGEFDLLVADLCNEGSTLEDAVAESIEIFSEEYDMTGLYIYTNQKELEAKNAVIKQLDTIEKTAQGLETPVNCMVKADIARYMPHYISYLPYLPYLSYKSYLP